MLQNRFGNPVALEDWRDLTPQQRQILLDLNDRGPGLLVELAVRQLALPEQIGAPLAELQDLGLVRGEPFAGGPLGDQLYFLTDAGRQAVSWLRTEGATATSQRRAGEKSPQTPPDPRWQEVELLRKLGDLADRAGQLAEAQQYYRQALDLTRSLAEGRGTYDTTG